MGDRKNVMKISILKFAILIGLAVGSVLPMRLLAKEAKMRVGTYNIRCIAKKDKGERSWDDRSKDLFTHLRKLDMDVFGLQEVTTRQYREIKKAFPEYEMVGEFRAGKDFKGESVPVCYRKGRFLRSRGANRGELRFRASAHMLFSKIRRAARSFALPTPIPTIRALRRERRGCFLL